ncbi:MAG: metal-dependent hydrolase [Thermoanaerobaculia bacterium]
MDPLTHTLAGASLAQTRLGRLGALPRRLAATTLILGANLPDVDAAAYFVGSDFALEHRRGWTHGVLAAVLLPLMLAGLAFAWDRFRRRRTAAPDARSAARRPDDPRPEEATPSPDGDPRTEAPARFGPLLALAALAVWTHPLLDWLNTYGIRFFAPFDWGWSYGDAVYIVDPWLWLLLGGGLFLAFSRTRRALAAWGLLGLLTTLVVLTGAPAPARWTWLAGLALLAALRWRGAAPARRPGVERLGTAALAAAVVYTGLLVASEETGRGVVLRHLDPEARAATPEAPGTAGGPEVRGVMVGPEAADPFHRQVVVATREGYRLGRLDWLAEPRLTLEPGLVAAPDLTPVVRAALEAPQVRGFVTWMRFPAVRVEAGPDGFTVHLFDLRYARRPGTGFGTATVRLSPELQVVP